MPTRFCPCGFLILPLCLPLACFSASHGAVDDTAGGTSSSSSGDGGGADTSLPMTTSGEGQSESTSGAVDSSTTGSADSSGGPGTSTTGGSGSSSSTGTTGEPAMPRTCLEILQGTPSATNGVYTLTPDAGDPFDAYCDMQTDGGGWTLILKTTTTSTTFAFDSSFWTDNALHNADNPAPNLVVDGSDAKYEGFSLVSGNELRLQFVEPAHDITSDVLAGQTALELFSDDTQLLLGSENGACNGALLDAHPDYDSTTMRFAEARQFFGVNGDIVLTVGADEGHLRFGFGSNDETFSAWAPEIGIGWAGATVDGSLRWVSHSDCSSNCSCYGAGTGDIVTAANLWVR